MAPEIFIKAYARAATEEYQFSEEAPKIDAKNPAGKDRKALFSCNSTYIAVIILSDGLKGAYHANSIPFQNAKIFLSVNRNKKIIIIWFCPPPPPPSFSFIHYHISSIAHMPNIDIQIL